MSLTITKTLIKALIGADCVVARCEREEESRRIRMGFPPPKLFKIARSDGADGTMSQQANGNTGK